MEMEVIRQLIDAVNDFDKSLAAYEAEGSNKTERHLPQNIKKLVV